MPPGGIEMTAAFSSRDHKIVRRWEKKKKSRTIVPFQVGWKSRGKKTTLICGRVQLGTVGEKKESKRGRSFDKKKKLKASPASII